MVFVSASILMGSFANAERLTVGRTYPIEENDALEEIKSRAAQADWAKMYQKKPETWAAWKSVNLPPANANTERTHKPIYVVEQDVADRNGNILYPQGYKYNPLDYVKMTFRIVVINGKENQLEWLKETLQDTDQIYTAGGDPRELGKRLGRPVYIVNEKARERLALRAVPSTIEQSGNSLVIKEYYVPEH